MAGSVSRRHAIRTGLAAIGAVAVAPLLPGTATAATRDGRSAPRTSRAVPVLPWPAANDIVAATRMPTFPSTTFDVTAAPFNANPNGTTDNTAAFARAISACNAAGGGHVIVPAGTYLTGAIYLKSNVDLHLETGATLRFSGDVTKFPTVLTRYEGIECMNHSPMIYAHGEHNIALTGSGVLDAAGTSPWNVGSERTFLESLVAKGVPPAQRVVPGSGHFMRSTFVEPYACDTVLIQGVSLHNSRFWQLHPTLCTNVTIDGVTTSATNSNTDGCDPESCDHVVINNCTLGAGDDNISIKSGRDADGRRINMPSQNIVIVSSRFTGPWGAIALGSEQTGGIQNVYAFGCVADHTRYVLYVKSNTQRGGFSRNINLDSITGRNQKGAWAFVTTTYNGQTGSNPPAFGGFTITNSTGDTSPFAFNVSGLTGDHVRGLTAKNLTFTNITNTDKLSNVDNVAFNNVTINGRTVTH